jgi:hypothetical protein
LVYHQNCDNYGQCKIYINGIRVYGGKRDAGVYFDNPEKDIGIGLVFAYNKQVDWKKIYDGTGNLIMFEDFTNNPQRARPEPASLCPRKSCDKYWALYFNKLTKKSWSEVEITDEMSICANAAAF